MPKGEETALLRNTSAHKSKDTWNVEHPEKDLYKIKEGSIGKACTTVPRNRQRKKARKNKKIAKESFKSTEGRKQDKMATETKEIKITIVGTRNGGF